MSLYHIYKTKSPSYKLYFKKTSSTPWEVIYGYLALIEWHITVSPLFNSYWIFKMIFSTSFENVFLTFQLLQNMIVKSSKITFSLIKQWKLFVSMKRKHRQMIWSSIERQNKVIQRKSWIAIPKTSMDYRWAVDIYQSSWEPEIWSFYYWIHIIHKNYLHDKHWNHLKLK